jgi:hypothetical protein
MLFAAAVVKGASEFVLAALRRVLVYIGRRGRLDQVFRLCRNVFNMPG